jgi:beta-fructofuranosidase
MYAGAGFSDWEIGDIDVFIEGDVYHLFHLIIPNHDYIAHAISHDGISWKRVKNALFVGDPGSWDDDMLWTMHTVKVNGHYHQYYTGLRLRDRGITQKIGLASSSDLYTWEKQNTGIFPLSSRGPFYEDVENMPRKWLSFRDPFFYEENGRSFLLVCARAAHGPFSRRGCIALLELAESGIKYHPPILYPRMYDDVECPCVFKLDGNYYLIGSIREDVKVRYWFSDQLMGEYHCFHSDVLLPQGNYAARVVKDNGHFLIYNFYYTDNQVNSKRVLPPPKQLVTDDRGRLALVSFYRWEKMVEYELLQNNFPEARVFFGNHTASLEIERDRWNMRSRSGYELFYFQSPSTSFIWEGTIALVGLGKCGLLCDMDDQGNGYFIPFDVVNGVVKIRTWGSNPENVKQDFIFSDLQSNLFPVPANGIFSFRLIRCGNYIELSIDGVIRLSLMDYKFSAAGLGLYSASSEIVLTESKWKCLPDPKEEYAGQEDPII